MGSRLDSGLSGRSDKLGMAHRSVRYVVRVADQVVLLRMAPTFVIGSVK